VIDIDALENLHQSTSPGPWRIRRLEAGGAALPGFVEAPRLDPSHAHAIEVLGEDDTLYPTRDGDMEFIVAAHRDVPSLIDAVRALRKKVAEQRSVIVQRDPLEIDF